MKTFRRVKHSKGERSLNFRSILAIVNFCAVFGCSNRSNREKDRSYYLLQALITRSNEKKQASSRKRRATWLARIRRSEKIVLPIQEKSLEFKATIL